MRYVAQINSAYLARHRMRTPLLFPGAGVSDGVGFSVQRKRPDRLDRGSGDVERSDRRRKPVPAGYITNACGRDPFFFGSQPYAGLGQQFGLR